jgi:quercetin dioxygenase-like cupin family protein
MTSNPASAPCHHRLHRWADIASERINPDTSRQYITGQSVTVARFELKRGGVVPLHSHANEQVTSVMSGALKFTIEGREVVVRAGEILQISGAVPHTVEVLEDTIAIDVFSPVRQDWIDGTDTYFKR